MQYLQRVSRLEDLARTYWVDALIALLAIAGMLELVVGRDSSGAPPTDLWLSALLLAILVAPIFARRRFPFGGPAAYWVLAAAITFYDGLLIPFIGSLGVIGLATAFMLGNLRNGLKAGIGLAVVTVGIVVVVYNIPGTTTTSNFVFITLRFVVAWLAGYALRERAEQAEAAEERAIRAEREREAAARVAVAEERARIARELHDIVAHAVSVMVLQVGAVRHKLPDELAADREALRSVERAGRTALAEMRRLLSAMRRDGEEAELVPQPGLDGLDCTAGRGRPRRAPRRTARRRPTVRTSTGDRPLCVSDRPGGADQRAQACARQRRGRHRPLSAGRVGDRGPRQRSGQREERRPGARARGRPRAGRRSTVVR